MTRVEEAKEYFIHDRYAMITSGMDILEVDEERKYAKCCMPIDDRHVNATGAVMGGAIYTLADFTFAVATNFRQPVTTVTTVSQISFLGMAKGKTLYAETSLIKDGRRACFYTIDVKDELGTHVATVSATGTHIPKI